MIASSRYEMTNVPIRMKNTAQRVRDFALSSDIFYPSRTTLSEALHAKNLLNGPPLSDAFMNGAGVSSDLARPIGDRTGFAAISKIFANASILLLLFWRCPSAVSGLIVSVIVDAVNCAAGRANAHIRKEVFKAFLPTRAYCYPSPTILAIMGGFGIRTSLPQSVPCLVCGTSRKPSFNSIKIFFGNHTGYFGMQASAGVRCTRGHTGAANFLFGSAVASAFPIGWTMLSALRCRAKNSQASKPAPTQVNSLRHVLSTNVTLVDSACLLA